MNERIQLILKTKNISASKFADEIGVQRSSISHILSGRNNPSLDFIQKVLKRFPDINSSWILSGKGSMYNEGDLFSTLDEHKPDKSISEDTITDAGEGILSEEISENEENQDVQEEKQIKTPAIKNPQKVKETIKMDSPLKETTERRNQYVSMKPTGKKIDRIIIFYSDKSCIEYTPE
jgi:transcriptional regulator with XRE-family HTH domain